MPTMDKDVNNEYLNISKIGIIDETNALMMTATIMSFKRSDLEMMPSFKRSDLEMMPSFKRSDLEMMPSFELSEMEMTPPMRDSELEFAPSLERSKMEGSPPMRDSDLDLPTSMPRYELYGMLLNNCWNPCVLPSQDSVKTNRELDNLVESLPSPGSESSGVSSLDAEDAKKLANEQLPSSNSSTLTSEPSSAVHTESESSDGSSDGDDEKPTEQTPLETVQSADEPKSQDSTDDEHKQDADDDDDDDDGSVSASESKESSDDHQTDLVSNAAAQDDFVVKREEIDKASIDLDEIRYKNLKIMYQGRDILGGIGANISNKSWNVQFAHLPEKNYQMYINNRSQYNRLASGYESSEHYALNACGNCHFQFPVLVDADKVEQPANTAYKSSVIELLTQTLAQKLSVQSMASPVPVQSGQSMNLNNFMLNNNVAAAAAATLSQPYSYQNRNQFANIAATNNHSFKPNNNSNAFYGNNVMINALVNQIGNQIGNNNSLAFNSNFMNAINGTNNANKLNQLNLVNQNRQQQQQQQALGMGYGMSRQINKSGINFNANSHKLSMPTYSRF